MSVTNSELPRQVAGALAARCASIPGFPDDYRVIGETLQAITDLLIDLCRGSELEGQAWTPERQAYWLVQVVAVSTWNKWLGGAGLRAAFLEKFKSSNRPELQEWRGLGEKPPIQCAECNDNGLLRTGSGVTVACHCQAGRSVPPKLLDVANRSITARNPQAIAPAAGHKTITQDDVDEELRKRNGDKT